MTAEKEAAPEPRGAAALNDEQLLDQLEESLNRADATHTRRALRRLRKQAKLSGCNGLVEDVAAFMLGAGQPIRGTPGIPDRETIALAIKLVDEEVNKELLRTLRYVHQRVQDVDEDLVCEIADGVVDSVYVLVWTALAFGFGHRLSRVWRAVQDANMRKLDGPKDPETGKQLKPEGWQPPNVREAVYGE